MKKSRLFICLNLFLAFLLFQSCSKSDEPILNDEAETPSTPDGSEGEIDSYYQKADGKAAAELKTALFTIIRVGKRLEYGSGAGKTWSGFEKTDLHPAGHVWDMYSYNKVKFPGNGGVPSGMNIEHSVAKSW
ncbi:MAG: hypothetical protein RRZ66_08805, partial [Bacteroidales bacterium]